MLSVSQKIAKGHYLPTKEYVKPSVDRDKWRAYQDEKRDLEIAFRADLLAELGISSHPKAERLFEIAWERGHAMGLSEVVIEAETLAELIEESTHAIVARHEGVEDDDGLLRALRAQAGLPWTGADEEMENA
jgi:hypothetical protein